MNMELQILHLFVYSKYFYSQSPKTLVPTSHTIADFAFCLYNQTHNKISYSHNQQNHTPTLVPYGATDDCTHICPFHICSLYVPKYNNSIFSQTMAIDFAHSLGTSNTTKPALIHNKPHANTSEFVIVFVSVSNWNSQFLILLLFETPNNPTHTKTVYHATRIQIVTNRWFVHAINCTLGYVTVNFAFVQKASNVLHAFNHHHITHAYTQIVHATNCVLGFVTIDFAFCLKHNTLQTTQQTTSHI